MVTVDYILQNPFRTLTKDARERILKEGKPRPPLPNLRWMDVVNTSPDGQKTVVLTIFDVSTYDQVEWMTGCEKRQSLYCWPCLLFATEQSSWTMAGVSQLNCLRDRLKSHEKNSVHIKAMLDWQLSGHRQNPRTSVDVIGQNELIQRNREIVRRIIDVVSSLIMQQRPPRIASNDKNQLKIEDCLEMMTLLREYDALQCSIVDDALDVMQITPTIVNDIVDAITCVTKSAIQKEVHLSSYVSVILSEHSNDVWRSQISTVLRYLKDGKVCERFVGFTNSEKLKSNFNALQFISKVANDYQISSRLLGVAMDGSVIKSNKHVLNEFKNSLPSLYPHSFFAPCYFHQLEHVLQQSLCIHRECDSFFKHLKNMGSFFLKDSMIRKEFESFENGLLVDIETFKGMKYPELFQNLKVTRKVFVSFFDSIIKNCERWTLNDLMKTMCFREFLMKFRTIFLLEVFIKLFGLTRDLSNVLNSKTPETAFRNHITENRLQSLQNIKDKGFEELWVNANFAFESDEFKKPYQEKEKAAERSICRALFLDIITCFQLQIKSRLEHLSTLEFFHILNREKYTNGEFRDYVLKLISVLGPTFNPYQILSEMDMLSNTSKSGNDSVHDLLQFFIEKGLKPSFENLYRLSEVILSLPCKPPTTDGGPTKLDKIIPWTYSSVKGFSGDASMLCIESDYFREVRKRPSFYEDVIAKFQEINKTMELLYHK